MVPAPSNGDDSAEINNNNDGDDDTIEFGEFDDSGVPDEVVEAGDTANGETEDEEVDAVGDRDAFTEIDESKLSETDRQIDLSAPVDPVTCPVCERDFDGERGMRIHFGTMHQGKDIDEDGNVVNGDSDDDTNNDDDIGAGQSQLQAQDVPDDIETPDDDGMSAEEYGKKKQTVDDKWEEARNKYLEAGTNGHDTTRRNALSPTLDALEAETEYMSVRERSELGDHNLYIWSDEHGWVEGGEGVIGERMEAELGVNADDTTVEKAAAHLAKRNKVDEDELNGQDRDQTLVAFENGIIAIDDVDYDAATGTIDPHSVDLIEEEPEHRMTRRLPMQWDPDAADMDLVENWMQTLTGGDTTDARTLWEAGGHALLPRYDPQGFIVIIAEGSNGKTTLFNVLHAALGTDNTTAIPMDKITGSQFSAYRMVDRLANMHADISGASLTDVSAIKAATGDDRMEVERKGIDPWDARNRATQIMAANSPPAIKEQNTAVKRRLMPVILDVEFVRDADPDAPNEVEKDDDIEDRLTSDAGLAGIAVKFVEAARRLQEVGEFTAAEEYSGDERMEIYKGYADPIADFSRVCLERDPNGPGISIDDLKACYDAYATDQDHPAKQKSTLTKMLQKMQTTVLRRSDPRSWTDDDGRTSIYKGMQFTDDAKEHWLPEDAHWSKYGRPTDDDEAPMGDYTPVQMLEAGTGRHDDPVRVEVASRAETPSYGWDDQGVLKDGTDSVRYKIESGGTLNDGATYEVSKFIVGEFESARVLHIVPGMTEFELVESSDETRDSALDETIDDGDDNSGVSIDTEDPRTDAEQRVYEAVKVLSEEHGNGVPREKVLSDLVAETDTSRGEFVNAATELEHRGQLYEPETGRWRTT